MARIGSSDTAIELEVRRGLQRLGLRHRLGMNYRADGKKLPGRPDLVYPSARTVVFVHGCFWHAHNCHLFRPSKTRPEFWANKAAENRARDARVIGDLKSKGWSSLVIWECELRGMPDNEVAAKLLDVARKIRANKQRLADKETYGNQTCGLVCATGS